MGIKEVLFTDKSDLAFVEKLYIESFPQNERRPVAEMNLLLQNNAKFKIILFTTHSTAPIGFISYWIFDSFVFLEHFAIDPNCRGTGYGSQVLAHFIKQISLPIVAEIELPSVSDIALKRLQFYTKMNFRIWDIPYEQPAYEECFNPIPMHLITYGDLDLTTHYEYAVNQIYKKVYKVNF
ncbi:MAG: hypothetical protein RL662_896 [Bacteroidota bacterium]|jgi:GNAT superfamily N-acetyltransferase